MSNAILLVECKTLWGPSHTCTHTHTQPHLCVYGYLLSCNLYCAPYCKLHSIIIILNINLAYIKSRETWYNNYYNYYVCKYYVTIVHDTISINIYRHICHDVLHMLYMLRLYFKTHNERSTVYLHMYICTGTRKRKYVCTTEKML